MDTLDKLTMGPPDLIPHRSVTAQQPAFLPDKPQPVCVCVFDLRNRERVHRSLGTDGGDRCRGQEVPCGPGGCGQVVTHLSLLAREALVTDTSAGPCVLICVIQPKSL